MQQVWVHYDYMVMPDGQSLAPAPQSIQLVADAFAAHGIQLEIDPHHTALPYHALLDVSGSVPIDGCPQFGLGPQNIVEFTSLKSQYFHPTANHEWHYAIFGDLSACGGESGKALSTDFAVTLGLWRRIGVQVAPYTEGGTFMHELGHTLGLFHPSPNYASNDLSVMNYRFQFGIPYAAALGSTSIAGRKLDYSEEALPTLDESHLDETRGIGATLPSDRTDITSWTNPPSCSTCSFSSVGPASGPIDWNQDGILESDVAVDLDYGLCEIPPCSPTQAFEVQLGSSGEWAEVHQWLAGTRSPGPKTFEHENVASEPIVSAVSPAAGPQAGGNTVLVRGAHFEKATKVSFGNTPAASLTVLNDSTLSVVAPPGEGTVDVTVNAGDNPSPSISNDQYTYLPPPVVDSVTPNSGLPGMQVTISGSHLSTATAVSFGSTPAPSFTLVDDHTIIAVAPAGTDSVAVTVTGPGGTSAASPVDIFTYTPTVASLSPTSGLPGTLVTIHGSSLTETDEVCFGPTCLPAGWTIVDDNTITVTVPFAALAGTTVDVTVTTPGGTSPTSPDDLFTLL
jgi:IPT/TIG domain